MKKGIVFYFLFATAFIANAQKEADVMYFGGCDSDIYLPCECPPPLQGSIYYFNEDSVQQIIDPACMPLGTFFSKACFADRNTGEFLFACNGWRLINGNGQILSHKLWFDNMPHPGGTGGDTTNVSVMAGPLFLPHPGDSTKAYLFYGQMILYNVQNFTFRADKYFTYALLDIPTKSLISKNHVLLTDTSSMGDMQACRHANGRDWWIIKPDIWENKYFIGLLTPQGLTMNPITLANVPSALRTNTSSKFNIQGSKYIHFTGAPGKTIHEFDFDRCTGTLSNFVLHDISDSLSIINNSLGRISISPDGSKFYIMRSNTVAFDSMDQGLFQVDLATDSMKLISRYGYCPQMTPNGKNIYFADDSLLAPNQWLTRTSVITNPNASFNELNILKFHYTHPNSTFGAAPNNFAYMRLGADTLSICDSLSVITKRNGKQNQNSLVVFPNPATHYLQIEVQEQGTTQYKIINYFGQVLQLWQNNQITQKIELSNLNNGFYLLQATNNQGIVEQTKFVIQR